MPALTQALGNDASLLVRGRAAEALSLIGDTSAAAAIGQLAAAQVSGGHVTGIQADDLTYPLAPEVEAFRLAIYALTRLKAYDPLAAAVLDANGQPRLRWWPVAYALQRVGDKRALPALITLVKGDGVITASFAARGLGGLKDPSAVDALLPLTLNKNLNLRVQVRVVNALGAIGDARAVQPLLTLLDQPQLDPTLRMEVVNALGDAPRRGRDRAPARPDGRSLAGDAHRRVRRAREGRTPSSSSRCCRGSIRIRTGSCARRRRRRWRRSISRACRRRCAAC